MNGPFPEVAAHARPAGIIDTLQAGFNLVNRNLWLLFLPLLVDLVIWFGPQLTIAPLLISSLTALQAPPGVEVEMARSLEDARQRSLEALSEPGAESRYNLVGLLATPVLGLPSSRAGAVGLGPEVGITSAGIAAVISVAALAAGLVLAVAFYGAIAQIVREGEFRPRQLRADLGPLVGALCVLFVLLLGAVVGLLLPAALLLVLLNAAVPLASAIVGPLLLGIIIWGFIYLFFTVDAIFVSRLMPFRAMQASIGVVRHNIWSSLGFIGLIVVISIGFPAVWAWLASNLAMTGILLATIGHIYISAGVAAASMTYYKERFERLDRGNQWQNV